MRRVLVIATLITKSPKIFESKTFLDDLNVFRENAFSAPGCISVEVFKDTIIPSTKFYFVSQWESIELFSPHLNPDYSRRMARFRKNYLSSWDITVTYDLLPSLNRSASQKPV
jgi:quinol monooxygenase YgiN